jgi:signal transduction histidine kinase
LATKDHYAALLRTKNPDLILLETPDAMALNRELGPWTMYEPIIVDGQLQLTMAMWTLLHLGAPLKALLLACITGLSFIALTWYQRRARLIPKHAITAIAHELRTPLTSVRHLTQLLASGRVSAPDRQAQYLTTIHGEVDRLYRTVEQLLMWYVTSQHKPQYRFEPIEAHTFIADAMADLEPAIAYRGFKLHQDIRTATGTVHADAAMLTIALWTLIDNAMKYSGTARDIWVSTARTTSAFCISITDHGVGISRGEQRAVLREFTQGKNSRPGVGLGLAFAARICTHHRGKLHLYSEYGHGTTVTISIPIGEKP